MSPLWGHRILCNYLLAKVELDFKGVTLRRAPKVFQRRTSIMYHVGGHGAQGQARIQLKAITREDSVDVFFSFSGWYAC